MVKRLTTLFALVTLAFAAAASNGAAAATPAHGRISGVVPHFGQPLFGTRALSPASLGYAAPATLTFDASYESLINRYFADVAAASGTATNVYSVATQYYDNPGTVHVQYSSTVGGSYVSHDPLPASACSDGFDQYCLSDTQLQQEIQRVLTAKGWQGGLSHMFFLLTPNGVGSCDDSGVQCSTNAFCAYHSFFVDSRNEDVIYANEPYEGPVQGCTANADNQTPIDQGFPNNDIDSDTTINTISHEHNEAITDPLTDPTSFGWISQQGDENGDLCAYGFGTQTNPGTVGAYNQTINGHHYELQQEWSNADNGCVQKYPGGTPTPSTLAPQDNGPLAYNGGPVMHTNTTYAIYWLPTAGNTSLPVVTGTAAVNRTLTTSAGAWTGGATGFSYQWQRCSSTGTGCANIAGATATTYKLTAADGGHTVRSTVRATNVNGQSPAADSAFTGVVAQQPAATVAPAVSGVAAVKKTLSTTNGTWNTPVSFAYQWFRCAADGSGCGAIPGATTASYVLATADAGHTLKARVSGTNVVGTTAAFSNLTPVVVDVPSATKAPHVSGRAKVGKKLSGSTGTWTYSPTAYRYQWQRCNAHGGSCSNISHASHATYRLTRRDAGHRLRLRVTATNAAGSTTAASSPSGRVKR
jgi:hypothetical protein